MRKEKYALLLIILSLFLIILPGKVLAEERSIFVGDLIQIKVESREFTRDELIGKFKDFEVVDIKDAADGFIVILRSFETGEKTVQLGDKEVTVVVRSTLDEIERNEIYEGDLRPEKAGFSIEWKYVFGVLLIIFLVTGRISILRHIKKGKISSLTPYQRFINDINNILLDEDDYFVKLTLRFKEYMELSYSFRIRGKTTIEIIDEIRSVPGLKESLTDINAWLKESDHYKFSGSTATIDKKQKLRDYLEELVNRIEATKKGEV